MNIISNMQQIADLIIRPSRYLYKPIDLGPKTIQGSSKSSSAIIYHSDFEVINSRKQILRGSLYTTQKQLKNIKKIIIYLHCNSGCRIQGLAYMNLVVAEGGFSFFVFDFAGSGVSQGRYISLGYYEADDIKSVIKFLRRKINKKIKIGLWGRSMGAVAALRYLIQCAQQNESQNLIKCAILDSPFHSLKQLFVAIGQEKTNFPKLVLEVAMKYLKPIVMNKAKFDIDRVNLNDINKIKNCPGIFIASKNDSLIPFQQIDAIFRGYEGKKEMFFVDQSHNQPRNISVIRDAFKTMKRYFQNQELDDQNNNKNYTLYIEDSKCTINVIDQVQTENIHKINLNHWREENVNRSQIPSKEVSRKKLQLTIKSYSQRTLLFQKKNSQSQTPKKSLKEISFPQVDIERLDKRQISCLFEKKRNMNTKIKFPKNPKSSMNQRKLKNEKGSYDQFSEEQASLNNSQYFKSNGQVPNNDIVQKKPQITIRKFFKEENSSISDTIHLNGIVNSHKNDDENEGFYSHINLIKLNSNLGKKNLMFNQTGINHNYLGVKKEEKILEPILVNISNTPSKHIKSEKTLHQRRESNLKVRTNNTSIYNIDSNNIIHERKTMQHMANKKPPLIQNYKMAELRNSFEGKYRSQLIPKK